MHSKAELFQFYKNANTLPDYFGENWDAFYDSLASYLVGGKTPLIIVHDSDFDMPRDELSKYREVINDLDGMKLGDISKKLRFVWS